MEVYALNIHRGERYKNIWVLNNKERKIDNNIQFYLYLDALRDAAVKMPRLKDEVSKKYKRITRLTIGPCAIHI